MYLVAIAALNFFNPSIRVNSRRATLTGNGPPLLFSGGLYGSMTWRIYSTLLDDLKTDFTVIRFNDLGVTTKNDLESLADALGVNKVGFLSHSSVDPGILSSSRLKKAVMCDPVGLPDINNGLSSFEVFSQAPVLVLSAEKSREAQFPFIMNGFSLSIQGNVHERVFEGMGHADILDNRWADLADQIGIEGMRVSSANLLEFDDWTPGQEKNKNENKRKLRDEYRASIGKEIKRFFQREDQETTLAPSIDILCLDDL